MKVYAANPWYGPAAAQLRNLFIANKSPKGKVEIEIDISSKIVCSLMFFFPDFFLHGGVEQGLEICILN